MALEKIKPGVVDETKDFSFSNVSVRGNVDSGNIKTDNLLYANGVPWPIGEALKAGGANTQVQFNDSNNFGSSANFTFDKTANKLTVDKIIANGSGLTSITGGNVTGQVANALLAGTVYTNAQPNITSVGTLTGLNVTGNIVSDNANLGNLATANYFSGSGNLLSNIQGSNVSGQVSFAAVANKVAGSNVEGQVSYAATANAVAGANVFGQVANALIAGTVYTNAQPNITSVGTLSNLAVTGNITGGNANLGNAVVANYFIGNGSQLTGITATNSNYANFAGNVVNASQPNITSLGTLSNLAVTGNITSGNANLGNLAVANYFSGDGSLLTNLNITSTVPFAANANYANFAGNVVNASQPNITSVGNLTNLTVGNSTSNVVISNGNVNATGKISATGNVAGNYILGNGYYLTGISGASSSALVTSNINTIVAGSTISVVADYGNASYPGGLFTIVQLGPVSFTATDVWSTGSATKNAYANFLASSINTQNINITLSLSNANFAVNSSTDSITIGGSTITGANLLALNITANGTYTIPNTYFSSTVQTTTTSAVSLSLTTTRGVYSNNGTTLTATQPIAFTLNSLTGNFPSSTVPYFNLNQSFNWNTSVTGTVSAGNVTYSGGAISTTSLTTTGATFGTSTSIDSTSSYTLTTSDFYGAGLNGYGSRTIPSTVNGTVNAATKYYPVFYKITSSSTVPTLAISDSYLTHNYVLGDGATTSATTSQYLWIATPGATAHTFAYTFLGSQVGQLPAVTSTQTISGYSYNIYGFTNFSVATFLYTVT